MVKYNRHKYKSKKNINFNFQDTRPIDSKLINSDSLKKQNFYWLRLNENKEEPKSENLFNNYSINGSNETVAMRDIMSCNKGIPYQTFVNMLDSSNIIERQTAIDFLNKWYSLTLKEVTEKRKRNANIVEKSIKSWNIKPVVKSKSKKKVQFAKKIIMPRYNINRRLKCQHKGILKKTSIKKLIF